MSTAILHAGTFIHDFNDLIIKNQNTSSKAIGNQSYKEKFQRKEDNNMHFLKQRNDAYMTNLFASQQKRALQDVIGQQQQQQHAALARTVSTPITDTNQSVVNNLFTSLNDILNGTTATNGHRKLERTQSEPLPQTNTSRYKTELCRPFEEAGECKYGDKCQFAHGFHELRNLQRHPKYKTELCRTFHSVGFCPYGARCHFIHSSQEALTHNKNVAAYQARLQQQQQSRMKTMSLSTASDRETASSVGSLSPTMTHIQNQSSSNGTCYSSDQASPTNNIFTYSFSPSDSPILNGGDMPVIASSVSPPPIIPSAAMFIKPKFIEQTAAAHANVMKQIPEDARLPVFNQISSAIDSMSTLTI
ncbi:hypothetical protein PVAND_003963 [Polypedilum vanderplanki]|uniref:C3H1-type domain-containing protein n=1 Tax=Polypedilum vanderplanki TaxID=319348 RepID=A0A9J6BVN4_POLVA|nr:hypothetical protein PVAND_003963 [Polypedilum vanderplanki]